jgi:hypothetical protein
MAASKKSASERVKKATARAATMASSIPIESEEEADPSEEEKKENLPLLEEKMASLLSPTDADLLDKIKDRIRKFSIRKRLVKSTGGNIGDEQIKGRNASGKMAKPHESRFLYEQQQKFHQFTFENRAERARKSLENSQDLQQYGKSFKYTQQLPCTIYDKDKREFYKFILDIYGKMIPDHSMEITSEKTTYDHIVKILENNNDKKQSLIALDCLNFIFNGASIPENRGYSEDTIKSMKTLIVLTHFVEPQIIRIPGIDKWTRSCLSLIAMRKSSFLKEFSSENGNFLPTRKKIGQQITRRYLGKLRLKSDGDNIIDEGDSDLSLIYLSDSSDEDSSGIPLISSRKNQQQYSVDVDGLTHISVPKDGHCLYNAVALYLGQDVITLRQVVAANLEHNITQYEQFITLPQGKTIQDYISDVRNTNAWAGDLEITILIKLLNRRIISISPYGRIVNRQVLEQQLENPGEPIFVYYDNVAHYDGAILQAGYTAQNIINTLLHGPQGAAVFSQQHLASAAASSSAFSPSSTSSSSSSSLSNKIDQAELAIFLKQVANGQQNEAEASLQRTPALATASGDVTDHANRTFKGITAFQCALWNLDWHMWKMLLKYIPSEAAKAQGQMVTTGSWVREHGEYFDMQPLLNTLQTYVDDYGSWTAEQCEGFWTNKVGGAQLMLPMHVLQEYCQPERPFKPCPNFNQEITFARKLPDKLELLGKEHAIVKGIWSKCEVPWRGREWAGPEEARVWGYAPPKVFKVLVETDLIALNELFQARIQQRRELLAQLSNSPTGRETVAGSPIIWSAMSASSSYMGSQNTVAIAAVSAMSVVSAVPVQPRPA